MKKTLLITLDFPPKGGGVSNHLFNLVSNLPPDDVVVLTEPAEGQIQKTAFVVYRKRLLTTLPFIWPRWICLFFSVLKIIRKERIQCIQVGQILPIGTVALMIKKLFHIPYLVHTYGTDLTTIKNSVRKTKLVRSILAQADNVLTISHYTKQELVDLGVPEDKITIVYPCASAVPREIDQKTISDAARKFNIENRKIILTVGRLVERKGHDLVIKSLPLILKAVPKAHYIIAGHGPSLAYLQKLSQRLGVQDNISILNHVTDDELQSLYRLCDVFVMPSRALRNSNGQIVDIEGFGIVFLEANLFGKPVIGGKSGGQADAIADGISGVLVDPEDSRAVSRNVIDLLTHFEKAQRLGEQGRQRALREFQWKKEAEKIIKLST